MFRKVGKCIVAGGVLIAAAIVGGSNGLISLAFGWVLLGYLVWRAWPAVRADFARMPRLSLSPFRRRAKGFTL